MANRIEDSVQAYVAAWGTNDATVRAQLLERCWSKDGTLTLPSRHIVGREGLLAVMAAYRLEHPDEHAALTSAVDQHHQCFRVQAHIVGQDGTTYGNVTEVGEVDSEGRIVRVLSFVDPIPRQP